MTNLSLDDKKIKTTGRARVLLPNTTITPSLPHALLPPNLSPALVSPFRRQPLLHHRRKILRSTTQAAPPTTTILPSAVLKSLPNSFPTNSLSLFCPSSSTSNDLFLIQSCSPLFCRQPPPPITTTSPPLQLLLLLLEILASFFFVYSPAPHNHLDSTAPSLHLPRSTTTIRTTLPLPFFSPSLANLLQAHLRPRPIATLPTDADDHQTRRHFNHLSSFSWSHQNLSSQSHSPFCPSSSTSSDLSLVQLLPSTVSRTTNHHHFSLLPLSATRSPSISSRSDLPIVIVESSATPFSPLCLLPENPCPNPSSFLPGCCPKPTPSPLSFSPLWFKPD